jgi:phosphate acetyltransferase
VAQSVMVVATESGTGKSVVSLGLFDQLERSGTQAAYFKPVGLTPANGQGDPDVMFVHRTLGLTGSVERAIGVTTDEVTKAIHRGRYDEVLDKILEAHSRLAASAQVIVCEGVDSMHAFPALDSDINIDIAKNIDATMLLVTSAKDLSADHVIEHILVARSQLKERGAEVFGVLVNRVAMSHHDEYCDTWRQRLKEEGINFFGALPDLPALSAPRIRDIVRELNAQVLFGGEHLDARIGSVMVAAMGLDNALHYFQDQCLVIAPGDREEILLAASATYACENLPTPAGIVLTGGFEPRRKVMQLVEGLSRDRLPILRVDGDTYKTAIAINGIRPALEENQEDKALAIREAMEEYVDLDKLVGQKLASVKQVVTPRRFLRMLRDKARGKKKKIVLPEGNVERMIKATEELRRQDVVDIALIGDEAEIRKIADQLQVKFDEHVEIINPRTDSQFEDYVQTLVEARKHKALPEQVARDLMADRNYFGTMMVHKGRADGMVSGSTTTTAATLRPAFEFIKTRPGFENVSSVFFMCLPDRVLVYGDCAVIPKPTVEQLAEIALSSADTAKAFGIEPRVAMLSYSTGESGKGADVDFVREATKLVRERNPGLSVEGPIQYDAAIDPGVAKTKLPNSKVAGKATVFIFPDLNTGNNTYKAVQRSANAIAIGPVMQGLRKPVNDLSRGATVTDIVNTVIVTAIQAQAL